MRALTKTTYLPCFQKRPQSSRIRMSKSVRKIYYMDILNNKTILQTKIKRFTLKATASAILTLNAEAVMAQNCPVEIYGATLANTLCDFNGIDPSGNSVTVETGGIVRSIQMNHYTPTDSYIAVNPGGQVSNTSSTSAGITITNHALLSNGLSNNGTISNTIGVAISILTSTINGGVSNSGMISANNTGIKIESGSTINDDIFNSGTIVSNTQGTGIRLNTSTINGSIFNSGTISGSGNDSGMSILNISQISGDITNQGLIHAYSGNAIAMTNHSVIGGISNNGRIESTSDDGISHVGDAIHVSNESTIQNNITNSGVLSGGQNGISILSTSTVGGIINSGTISGRSLAGVSTSNSARVTRSITNTGTISGSSNGLNISTSTIDGSITNTGTISGGLTGINISTSTVSGGISNSGTIQGGITAINIANNVDLDILGQQARIIGNVVASFSDVNITDGALFTSEGSYDVNTFNIAQNALFNMANTISVATGFNNSGTLAVSNTLQTIGAGIGTGDYTQNTEGVFQMAVSTTTDYGQLLVTGAADLSQSGNIDVQIASNASLHDGDVLTNVISGNTFLQPTNDFNVTDNSAIWKLIAALNNTNKGVNLTLAIDPTAYTVCQGLYCQGAADTIIGQVTAGNSLFSPYGALSTVNALQTAASQATPELTNENIQIIQLITRAIVDIAPMWSSLRGKSSGDAMLYQPGKIWVKPYGASMTQNERTTVNGFNATAYGAVVGKDIELSNHYLFGGAVAAGGDNIQGKSVLSGQSIQSNAYQGMLYGAKKLPKQFYVAGQGLVGYENNNTSRTIPLYASTAKGFYNSWFTNIRAEAGWSAHAFGPNLVFTPEIDASYLFINQSRYQESGSPMNLSVAANNNASLVLGAYGNGAYHLTTLNDQHDLTLTAYAGVAGDVINSQTKVTSTFVTAGSSFSTFGVQFNEAVFRGGAGLTLTSSTKPLIVELNYDLQVGNNAYSGIGAATIKYKL